MQQLIDFFAAIIFSLVLGIGFLCYAIWTIFSYKKISHRMLKIPLNEINTEMGSVIKTGRFRWIEFKPLCKYSYTYLNKNYISDRIYINGYMSYEKKQKAENVLSILKSTKHVYVDPLNPNFSSIHCELAPAKKSHLYGVLGGGFVLLTVGFSLFSLSI